MQKIRILIIAAFCWLSGNTFGQSTLGAVGILLPDTIILGTPDSFFVQIQNTDSNFFSGTLDLSMELNGHPSVPFTGIPMTLPPYSVGLFGSSLFNYDTLNFLPGSNIVVVWPTGTGISSSFTATKTVFVIDHTGMRRSSSHTESELTIFPNPAVHTLYLQTDKENDPIEEVRIFNILGEQILQINNPKSEIDISDFYPGIYITEVRFKNNNVVFKKFTKSQ